MTYFCFFTQELRSRAELSGSNMTDDSARIKELEALIKELEAKVQELQKNQCFGLSDHFFPPDRASLEDFLHTRWIHQYVKHDDHNRDIKDGKIYAWKLSQEDYEKIKERFYDMEDESMYWEVHDRYEEFIDESCEGIIKCPIVEDEDD